MPSKVRQATKIMPAKNMTRWRGVILLLRRVGFAGWAAGTDADFGVVLVLGAVLGTDAAGITGAGLGWVA